MTFHAYQRISGLALALILCIPHAMAHVSADAPQIPTDTATEVKTHGEELAPLSSRETAELKENFVLDKMQELICKEFLQLLYSKLDTLNLMVSTNALKLTQQEKQQFADARASIKDALEKNIETFQDADKQHVAGALAFTQALLEYIQGAITTNLKHLKPFSFTYTPPATPPAFETLLEQFNAVAQGIDNLEASFKDIGLTPAGKVLRSIENINQKYGIGTKAKYLGAALAFAAVGRYLLKSDRLPAANENLALPVLPTYPQPTGFWARSWSYIDDSLIGTKPQHCQKLNAAGEFVPSYVQGTGTGFIGRIHAKMPSVLSLAGFITLFKTTSDAIVDGINTWKSAAKDPKAFVKFGELFYNKKQNVSPLEELFLSSAIEHSVPQITFDDIAGLHEQKKELIPIINYLLHPELFEKTGTSIEKGYLLYGPTRTGKTYLAEALAGEIVLKHKRPLSFLKIKGSELRMVGIKKVLDIVNKYAPCIVFIDELDLLNLQRDHNAMLLDEFLTSMKPDTGNHQVIFLAATNRIDHIDNALLQPGRFGKTITFENPSLEDRKEFFIQQLARKNLFDPELIDLDKLSQETEGCSFGDLSSVVNHALSKATQSKQILTYGHFDEAIDVFKRKITDSTITLPEEEKQLVAAHLAGHALAYLKLPTGELIQKVTMLPIQKKVVEEKIWLSDPSSTGKKITTFGDVFTLHRSNTGGFDSPSQKINKVKVLLAGHCAEKVLLGSSSYSYHNDDNEQARLILESLAFKGMKRECFTKEVAEIKFQEVIKLFEQYESEVMKFLEDNKELLTKIANELKKNVTLTAQDLAAIEAMPAHA